MTPVFEPQVLKPAECTDIIAPLIQSRSGAGICGGVRGRQALPCRPQVHPARDRGKNLSVATCTAPVIDYTIRGAVCFKNGHIQSTGSTWLLHRGVGINGIWISPCIGVRVECSRVWCNRGKGLTEFRIASDHAEEATAVAVPCSKDPRRVHTEFTLDVDD